MLHGVMTRPVIAAMGRLIEDGVRNVVQTADGVKRWLPSELQEHIDTLTRTAGALLQLAAVELQEGDLVEAHKTTMLAFEQYGQASATLLQALTRALDSRGRGATPPRATHGGRR